MKAIALPYTEYQNEPSRPFSTIVDIPDSVEERDKLITKMFFDHVLGTDEQPIVTITEHSGWADLEISALGCYLFFTYIIEE